MISKKLLHAMEELRWLSVAKFFSANELLDLVLLRGSRMFDDELFLQLVVWVFRRRQWQIQGGKGDANEPPFGLHLTLRSTDDRLNGTPLSGYRTKKTAAMAHLRML